MRKRSSTRESDFDMATAQPNLSPISGGDSQQANAGMHMPPSVLTDYHEELRNDYAKFDLPIVEYARLHGLTSNYLLPNPLDSNLVPQLPEDWQADLEEPDSETNIDVLVTLGALDGHTAHEKLDIDKEAAELLASVIKFSQDDDALEEWLGDVSFRFKDLKLEEPILLSDPQLDLMRLKGRNMAVLSTDGMQPFADSEIEDPGFISPEKDAAMRVEIENLNDEKLDIDRPTMEYLGDICKMLSQDGDDDIEMLLSDRKARFPSPVTPPLLPSSPSLQAFASNVEADEMDFTSSPEDLIRKEAAELERRILGDDSSSASGPDGYGKQKDIDLSVYDIPDDSSSSPPPRKRLKDLRIETPLTPENSLDPPAKKVKTVSFSEELHTLIPNFEFDFATSEPAMDDGEFNDFIKSAVEPSANSALKELQEERLDEFDTTLRVPVPQIDDFALAIPWRATGLEHNQENELSSHRLLLSQTKTELAESEKKWSGASKTERQLPWTPFPAKLGEVNVKEEFDDGSLPRDLAELVTDDEIDVESLSCAPNVLRVLQEDEDDLILEPYEFVEEEVVQIEQDSVELVPQQAADDLHETPNGRVNIELNTIKGKGFDMRTLLNMRRMELDATQSQSRASETRSGQMAIISKPHQSVAAKPTRFTEISTTAGGLANSMRLHGRPLPTMPPTNSPIEPEQQQIPAAPVTGSAPQIEALAAKQHNISLASPTVTSVTNTFHIITLPTIIADRDLLRELRKSLPGLEVVTRDLLSSNSHETKQGVNDMADITTSPSTGIITTTLQKLKQRPLPGQSVFFGVRDRIALVSCRYSRLVLLVSEGRKQNLEPFHTSGPLDSHDVNAISDLIAFASSLEHDVEVQFVPGGDPQLATWLAACISSTIPVDDTITLIEEELIWERLLRQAGLNPFAAQYVLSKLKPKETSASFETSSISNLSSKAPSGLAAFFQMTTSQRLEMFGRSIGRRVIERVGKVVDGGFIPNLQKRSVPARHLSRR